MTPSQALVAFAGLAVLFLLLPLLPLARSLSRGAPLLRTTTVLDDAWLDELFAAAIEATEEAVIDSLFRADTVTGRDGHVAEALPIHETIELLARAGSDKAKILRAEIFLKDLQDFEAMNRVWDAWVPAGHAPPRATMQAHLARPGWLIEIVVTAAV